MNQSKLNRTKIPRHKGGTPDLSTCNVWLTSPKSSAGGTGDELSRDLKSEMEININTSPIMEQSDKEIIDDGWRDVHKKTREFEGKKKRKKKKKRRDQIGHDSGVTSSLNNSKQLVNKPANVDLTPCGVKHDDKFDGMDIGDVECTNNNLGQCDLSVWDDEVNPTSSDIEILDSSKMNNPEECIFRESEGEHKNDDNMMNLSRVTENVVDRDVENYPENKSEMSVHKVDASKDGDRLTVKRGKSERKHKRKRKRKRKTDRGSETPITKKAKVTPTKKKPKVISNTHTIKLDEHKDTQINEYAPTNTNSKKRESVRNSGNIDQTKVNPLTTRDGGDNIPTNVDERDDSLNEPNDEYLEREDKFKKKYNKSGSKEIIEKYNEDDDDNNKHARYKDNRNKADSKVPLNGVKTFISKMSPSDTNTPRGKSKPRKVNLSPKPTINSLINNTCSVVNMNNLMISERGLIFLKKASEYIGALKDNISKLPTEGERSIGIAEIKQRFYLESVRTIEDLEKLIDEISNSELGIHKQIMAALNMLFFMLYDARGLRGNTPCRYRLCDYGKKWLSNISSGVIGPLSDVLAKKAKEAKEAEDDPTAKKKKDDCIFDLQYYEACDYGAYYSGSVGNGIRILKFRTYIATLYALLVGF